MEVKRNVDIKQTRALDYAKGEAVRQQAQIDYIAMMTDVVIPTEEATVNEQI